MILEISDIPLFEYCIKCFFAKSYIQESVICTISTNLIHKFYEFGFGSEFDSRLSYRLGYRFNCRFDNVLKTNPNKANTPLPASDFYPRQHACRCKNFTLTYKANFYFYKHRDNAVFSFLDFLIFFFLQFSIFLFFLLCLHQFFQITHC